MWLSQTAGIGLWAKCERIFDFSYFSQGVFTCSECDNETEEATFYSVPKKENIWKWENIPWCMSDLPDTSSASFNSLPLILNLPFFALLCNTEVPCRHVSFVTVSMLGFVTRKNWRGTAGGRGFLLPVCCLNEHNSQQIRTWKVYYYSLQGPS